MQEKLPPLDASQKRLLIFFIFCIMMANVLVFGSVYHSQIFKLENEQAPAEAPAIESVELPVPSSD